jgi:hypothetical protein
VAATVLPIAAAAALVSPAQATEPASGSLVHSQLGFAGCVDPGFTPGVVTRDYCFVAVRIPSGPDAGSVSVRAWTFAHSLPGAVLTDERVVAPAAGLEISADGSFSLSVNLPQMGSVAIAGVGAGVHAGVAQDEGNTSFPLTYAVASPTSSITPYDAGFGPNYMRSGAVAGERQVELQAAVWTGDVCGHWQFAGVV